LIRHDFVRSSLFDGSGLVRNDGRPTSRDGRSREAQGGHHVQRPRQVPVGRGLDVRFQDPEYVPGDRGLVQAQVRLTCSTATAATIRRTPVSLTIVDVATGHTKAVLQGVAQ
jgi:hypothetical protein